jgi:flagellar biosynthetic protein FlhB
MPGEKTEQPTTKKLQEARRKGQVCKSNDLTQSLLLLTAAGIFYLGGGSFVLELQSLIKQAFQPEQLVGLSQDQLLRRFGEAALRFFLLSTPLLCGLVAVSLGVSFVQVRALFAAEIIKPKFEKLNPLAGFQNIFFKPRTYLELGKNLLKLCIVAWLAYKFVGSSLRDLVMTATFPLEASSKMAAALLFRFLFTVAGAFLLMGAADYLLQKKLYMKELMMSKEEVVREYKESEGDPHMKSLRKQLHEEILSQSMIQNVPKADVIIVNPTHLAVAVEYEEKTMNAPKITAKGQNTMAARIVALARSNEVPVLQNIGLARSLYEVEIDTEVPEDLYEAVAEVLNWVYQLAEAETATQGRERKA